MNLHQTLRLESPSPIYGGLPRSSPLIQLLQLLYHILISSHKSPPKSPPPSLQSGRLSAGSNRLTPPLSMAVSSKPSSLGKLTNGHHRSSSAQSGRRSISPLTNQLAGSSATELKAYNMKLKIDLLSNMVCIRPGSIWSFYEQYILFYYSCIRYT